MDPDKALADIREQLAAYFSLPPSPDFDLDKLAETAQGLDEFLSRGGFLPSAWHQAIAAKGDRVFPT